MELTAAKRPFIYFPLVHHFEQNFHVRHRLDQYGAGTCMDFATTDPDAPRRRDRPHHRHDASTTATSRPTAPGARQR